MIAEVGQRDSDQCQASLFDDRSGRGQQSSSHLEHGGGPRRCLRDRVRARGARVIAKAQAQHDRPARPVRGTQPAGDTVDERHQRRLELPGSPRPPPQRSLGADRAPSPAGAHRPRIPVVGERVQLPSGCPPEHRDQRLLAKPRDLADRGHAVLAQTPRGNPAHPPQPLDRERMQERKLSAGRDHEQAIRLGHPVGHFGQKLRARQPHGDREPYLVAHLAAKSHGDLGRGSRDPLEPPDVEERLVDRESLDQRGGPLENGEYGLARLCIRRHPRRHEDRPRAQRPRPRAAHRRPDSARLGFVAGGEHDSAADDHGTTSQAGIVSLLDRGIESVEVRM